MRTNILGILKISMASLFLLGCSSGGSDDETVDPINNDVIPTNLSLSINLTGSDASNPNGDGTGQANFQVSASNAVRYAVKIDNNPLIESNSGSISYTFNDDGTNTYIVSAFAYSSTDNSISTFESVTVFVGNEPGYQLVWSDEFDVAGAPNPSYWTYDIGDGCSIGICGWGNGEEQFYTDRSDNVIVEDGLLKIMSKKESFSGSSYTSARIKTKGLFDFKYGKLKFIGRDLLKFVLPGEFAFPKDVFFLYYPNSEKITRLVEYKKFTRHKSKNTLIGLEIPSVNGRYYPVPFKNEQKLAQKYFNDMPEDFYSIGRAGTYRYEVDIDDCIWQSIQITDQINNSDYQGPIVGEHFKIK